MFRVLGINNFVDGFTEWDLLGFGLKQGQNEAPFLHLYSLYGLSVKYMAKLQYVKPPVNQPARHSKYQGQLVS
jgi:hypothetical protein